MRNTCVVILCVVCLWIMVNAMMAAGEGETTTTTIRHPRDVSAPLPTTEKTKQRRDADDSGKMKMADEGSDDDDKKNADEKKLLGIFGHGHGHGFKRYRRDSATSTTPESGSNKNKESDKIDVTTKRPLRQIGLHVTTETSRARGITAIKRQVIRERTTTPTGRDDSSSEEDKGRKSRDIGDQVESESESTESHDRPQGEGRPGSFRLRRQEEGGSSNDQGHPSIHHHGHLDEGTMRKERQTPGAPGAPAADDDLSARRGGSRPVRPRPPPPPPHPGHGGEQTLTLPDGIDVIVNPINPGFTCDGKIYGYYADTFNDCKLFHVCVPITNERGDVTPIQWSFACGNQTLFNQEKLTCDHTTNVDCSRAQDYYNINENFGKTDRPFA